MPRGRVPLNKSSHQVTCRLAFYRNRSRDYSTNSSGLQSRRGHSVEMVNKTVIPFGIFYDILQPSLVGALRQQLTTRLPCLGLA
jgi:hypothetical protein